MQFSARKLYLTRLQGLFYPGKHEEVRWSYVWRIERVRQGGQFRIGRVLIVRLCIKKQSSIVST